MQNYRFVFSLSPKPSDYDSNAPVCFPKNIFDPLPTHEPQPHHYEDEDNWKLWQRGREIKFHSGSTFNKDWRRGPISIDWFEIPKRKKKGKKSVVKAEEESTMREPASSTSTPDKRVGKGAVVANFVPDVDPDITHGTANLPQGIIRIFRDTFEQKPESKNTPTSEPTHTENDGTTLAVLAIPFFMTPADFLAFLGTAEENIVHLRLIRDGSPSRTIALIKFRTRHAADEFGEAFNGKEFLPTESEICHVVRVLSVDIDVEESPSVWSFSLTSITQQTSEAIYELPTCPVCLERMDFSVTGLVTVPCSHTFHCVCLSMWGDSRCPVCRYSQNLLSSHPSNSSTRPPFNSTPSDSPVTTCNSCDSRTNLWICLICGNVGCGRYGRAHAHAHYQSTMHLYALELETQRVWDYAGDGYVHRLIHNKADGKLVELPSASTMTTGPEPGPGGGPGRSDALAAEKIEAIGIEYSYLLTSQLDSQRAYFEEQKKGLETALEAEHEIQKELREQIAVAEKGRAKAEEKMAKMAESSKKLEKALREERAMSDGLKRNMEVLKERADSAERERKELQGQVADLSDQLRDVMFFLQARDKIESAEPAEGSVAEAAGGDVVVPPPPEPKTGRKRRNK